jgi:hypothetical protein
MNPESKTTEIYDTTNTERASALIALGCDTVRHNPIRRIFSDGRPRNNRVGFGLHRGGECQYILRSESDQFDRRAGEIAQAYEFTNHPDRDPEAFDRLVADLRAKTRGTEAGQIVEQIIAELPLEIARYIRTAMEARRGLIDMINGKLPESRWFDSRAQFPSHGDPGLYYIDRAATRAYQWDGKAYAETTIIPEFARAKNSRGMTAIFAASMSPDLRDELLG